MGDAPGGAGTRVSTTYSHVFQVVYYPWQIKTNGE